MPKFYEARDRDGKPKCRRLQVIRKTDRGEPMYGWLTGGFIDPLDVRSGRFTIHESDAVFNIVYRWSE